MCGYCDSLLMCMGCLVVGPIPTFSFVSYVAYICPTTMRCALFACLCLSLSLFASPCLSLSMFASLCLYWPLFASVRLCLPLFTSLCLSLRVLVSLAPLCLYLSVSLSLCHSTSPGSSLWCLLVRFRLVHNRISAHECS